MTYAFSGVPNSKWNKEVIEYLASKFNTITPRFIVLSKAVFINATLAKFDGASFIINGACGCLELSFAKVDADKMEPVIQEILKWEAFTKHESAFYMNVDKDTSRSILFDSGKRNNPKILKEHFHNYETEVIQFKKKKIK